MFPFVPLHPVYVWFNGIFSPLVIGINNTLLYMMHYTVTVLLYNLYESEVTQRERNQRERKKNQKSRREREKDAAKERKRKRNQKKSSLHLLGRETNICEKVFSFDETRWQHENLYTFLSLPFSLW